MSDAVDAVIVGAGPYGLSVAAHLNAAGVRIRQFGLPMRLWREAMPRGMYLKSQGFASNLSDPDGSHTLEAFCRKTGHPYASYGLPVPLDNFVNYGQWFADELAPGLEQIMVTSVAPRSDGGYAVTLADGEVVPTRQVVVAAGVEHFARVPSLLSQLSPTVSTHTSAHTDLSRFAGQRVAVIGAGNSALETAALLHESGADAQLIARADHLVWNGQPLDPDRPLVQRIREPESGLGSGWSTWLYSRHPELFRHLPQATRIERARTALGPAGAVWLRSRFEGHVPAQTSTTIASAAEVGDGVRLGLTARDGTQTELTVDHVIAGTGYKWDLERLSFLDPGLRDRLATVDGSPEVGRDYQSSVPGLYVVGPAVTPTMGPVMRFVYGSAHAAPTVARSVAGPGQVPSRAVAYASR